ncbi:winged helix-turn-helix domain-containing protein [Halalkalicoccus jeotgali]|uniref:Transcriptional regulator, MarR family protein n=1 Tax=Halalkalicoccus jeotgali (strain DSM 18796 / CECT 7217 / JCM 14584 / KCTC 4019 / B3) TaxID=795797 RepID=D8JC21_HALJB|nr:helix-turn-helix domain-containing protein [Halalkalicoccus jeotgali]ADJ16928.1 transcriptional regulator, MarR family protein [Halalkalicoccus jeotgali B3]ELY38635.1 transcriptional regulator, MarR family protein [Halalkalicoccus jeotgali B3]
MASTGADTDVEGNTASQLIADVTAELLEETNPQELSDFTDRFKAVAHPLRFAILYRLRDADGMSAKELSNMTGRSGNALHSHLDKLVETNLVTHWKQTDPEKHQPYSYYAISGLGARTIDFAVELVAHEGEAFEEYQ